jgi:hypothetical protein
MAMERRVPQLPPSEKAKIHNLLLTACRQRRQAAKTFYLNAPQQAKEGHEFYLTRLEAFCTGLKSPETLAQSSGYDPKLSDIDGFDYLISSILEIVEPTTKSILGCHEKAVSGEVHVCAVSISTLFLHLTAIIVIFCTDRQIVCDYEYRKIFSSLDTIRLLAEESGDILENLKTRFDGILKSLGVALGMFPTLLNIVRTPKPLRANMDKGDLTIQKDCKHFENVLLGDHELDPSQVLWDKLTEALSIDIRWSGQWVNFEETFYAFIGHLSAHILLQLHRIWTEERIVSVRKEAIVQLGYLEAQINEAVLDRRLYPIDKILSEIRCSRQTAEKACDISSIAARYTWASRSLVSIGEYALSMPLVPAMAHLYTWGRIRKTLESHKMLDQLCTRLEKGLFWQGIPGNPNDWETSFTNWVLGGYRPESGRNDLWKRLAAAKIENQTFFAMIFDRLYVCKSPIADDTDRSRSFYSKSIWERLDVVNGEMEDLSQFDPYLIAQLVRKVTGDLIDCKGALGSDIEIAKSLRAAKDDGNLLAEFFQQLLELWQERVKSRKEGYNHRQ